MKPLSEEVVALHRLEADVEQKLKEAMEQAFGKQKYPGTVAEWEDVKPRAEAGNVQQDVLAQTALRQTGRPKLIGRLQQNWLEAEAEINLLLQQGWNGSPIRSIRKRGR